MSRTKVFAIPGNRIRTLVTGHGAALATDRIVVEGHPVGHMYREVTSRAGDSGWRFFAGDEDNAYQADPDHSGVYAVNTIANYDPAIIPYLHTPGSVPFRQAWCGVHPLNRPNAEMIVNSSMSRCAQ